MLFHFSLVIMDFVSHFLNQNEWSQIVVDIRNINLDIKITTKYLYYYTCYLLKISSNMCRLMWHNLCRYIKCCICLIHHHWNQSQNFVFGRGHTKRIHLHTTEKGRRNLAFKNFFLEIPSHWKTFMPYITSCHQLTVIYAS